MGDIRQAWSQLMVVIGAVLGAGLLLTGCGGDGDNNDTIWTGFSGVVILIIVVLAVRHWMKKKG